MKRLKQIRNFSVVLLALLLIPSISYALVDASVYGGYDFGGKLEGATGTKDADVNGYHYGARVHANTGIPMVFSIGGGMFYQIAPLKYKVAGKKEDLKKETLGIDVYAQLELPVLPVYPYVRYGIAINDKVDVTSKDVTTGESRTDTLKKAFKSSYYGIGIAYSVLDAAVLDVQIFAEYLYTTSKQEKDVKLKGNAVNIGAQIMM